MLLAEEPLKYEKAIPFEKKEINGKLSSKSRDLYLRLDCKLDFSSRALFQVISEAESWPPLCKDGSLVQCVKNKQIDTLKSGLEVFQMVLERDSDSFDFFYKRWIRSTPNN